MAFVKCNINSILGSICTYSGINKRVWDRAKVKKVVLLSKGTFLKIGYRSFSYQCGFFKIRSMEKDKPS